MDWDVFQESHFRPHLVVVRLPDVNPRAGTSVLDRWLAGASGNYALKQERQAILVAFETDREAARFSSVLQATPTERGHEWASKTEGRLDSAAQKKIARIASLVRE